MTINALILLTCSNTSKEVKPAFPKSICQEFAYMDICGKSNIELSKFEIDDAVESETTIYTKQSDYLNTKFITKNKIGEYNIKYVKYSHYNNRFTDSIILFDTRIALSKYFKDLNKNGFSAYGHYFFQFHDKKFFLLMFHANDYVGRYDPSYVLILDITNIKKIKPFSFVTIDAETPFFINDFDLDALINVIKYDPRSSPQVSVMELNTDGSLELVKDYYLKLNENNDHSWCIDILNSRWMFDLTQK